VRLLEFLSVFS